MDQLSRPVSLDYNAATPNDPEVGEAMLSYFESHFDKPSSSSSSTGHACSRGVGAGDTSLFDWTNAEHRDIGTAVAVIADPVERLRAGRS